MVVRDALLTRDTGGQYSHMYDTKFPETLKKSEPSDRCPFDAKLICRDPFPAKAPN